MNKSKKDQATSKLIKLLSSCIALCLIIGVFVDTYLLREVEVPFQAEVSTTDDSRQSATPASATLSLKNLPSQPVSDNNFSGQLWLEGEDIDALDVVLSYDEEKIKPKIVYNSDTALTSYFDVVINKIEQPGLMVYSLVLKDPQVPFSGRLRLAIIDFEVLKEGTTNISFDSQFTKVSRQGENVIDDYPSYSVTISQPEPSPTPQDKSLIFKIKFQGIESAPAVTDYQQVSIQLTNGKTISSEKKFVSDSNGVFSNANDPAIIPGEYLSNPVYKVLVKGPKHRQIRFDDVDISSGEVDLTYKVLEAGDLPEPGVGQDGRVDANDISLAEQRLGSTNAQDLEVADVDLNGVINAGDIHYIHDTLSVKQDEI